MSTIRINKALADAGLCSRRKAETLIAQGRVTVNDMRVTALALRVNTDTDTVAVDGTVLAFSTQRLCLLMHKPVQTVCTVHDPQGRTTVLNILPTEYKNMRLYPVGRLDYFSEGLLLLTDDGHLAQWLAHPRNHIPRIYQIIVRGTVSEKNLLTMRCGMTLAEGEKLAPVEITSALLPQDRTQMTMTLYQGVNRQIRRMCRDLGLTILRLKRVQLGPLALGDLAPGAVRILRQDEVTALYTYKM